MAKVQVEIGYWLSERIVPEEGGRLLLEEEVEEGETLSGFLEGLAARHSGFGEVIYDPERRELYPYVQMIYKGCLIRWKEASRIALADGDRIAFQPMYAGG